MQKRRHTVELVEALRQSRRERQLNRRRFRDHAAEIGFSEPWDWSFDPTSLPGDGWLITGDGDNAEAHYVERGKLRGDVYAGSEEEVLGMVLEQFELDRDRPPPVLAVRPTRTGRA